MPLLRSLAMICARLNFVVSAKHVPGHINVIANSLSCNNLQAFRRPAAQDTTDTVPKLPWLDL